jgi:hypothetical protein
VADTIDGSGFDGYWYMNREESRWLDRASGLMVPEPIAAQTLKTVHHGDVFEGWCSVMPTPGVVHHLYYKVKFDDSEWAPYTCIGAEGPEKEGGEGELLKNGIRVGEPIAYLKQVWVDERTQYRVCRNPDGTPQYVMMRRLSEDGQINVGTCVDPSGVTFVSKVLTRTKPEVTVDVLNK